MSNEALAIIGIDPESREVRAATRPTDLEGIGEFIGQGLALMTVSAAQARELLFEPLPAGFSGAICEAVAQPTGLPGLDEVYCPGCAEKLPKENHGCAACGYEGDGDGGRLLSFAELIAMPSYPDKKAPEINDVCPAFLGKLSQAASQSASVPVLGEALLFQYRVLMPDGEWCPWSLCAEDTASSLDMQEPGQCETRRFYLAPTDHVTREELEALRKNAAIGLRLIEKGAWHRFGNGLDDSYAICGIKLPYAADLSSIGSRRDALDRAMQDGK